MKSTRYWTVLLLLVSTAIVLHTRGDADRGVPYSEPLNRMPQTIAGLSSRDLPIGEDVLSILGKGDFLNRIYAAPAGSPPVIPISLFIGYFASQRTGQSIHSPQNCLPGAGWTFDSKSYTELTADNGQVYHVGEYVISNGGDRQFVVYWYQSHGRSIANEYSAKIHMIFDAIRMNRTDGAIVRVITPMLPSESTDDARGRVVNFTAKMAPTLPRFIPN